MFVRHHGEPQHRRGTDGAGDQQPGISIPAQGAGRICAVRYRSRRLRAQAVHADPYVTQYPDQRQTGVSRPLTIDDVVTKTGITLAVLSARRGRRATSWSRANPALAMPLYLVGMIGGIAMLLIAIFGRKQDNPAIVLSYAGFEGLFLGAFSYIVANFDGVRYQRRRTDQPGGCSARSVCSSACSSSTRPAPSASRRSSLASSSQPSSV